LKKSAYNSRRELFYTSSIGHGRTGRTHGRDAGRGGDLGVLKTSYLLVRRRILGGALKISADAPVPVGLPQRRGGAEKNQKSENSASQRLRGRILGGALDFRRRAGSDGLLLHTGSTLEWIAPDVLAAPWWRML
jgi:hypothetical protein